MIHWLARALVDNPAIAVFLSIGFGFLVGKLHYRTISLGAVTGTLLVALFLGAVVTVGSGDAEKHIVIGEPMKTVFFLLFLFALGYRLGPQFVAGLKGSGVAQAVFALVFAVVAIGVVIVISKILGYNAGLGAGLAAGGLTQSAIIGVAQGSIAKLHQPADTLQQWSNLVPVAYAVTYVFGTVGTALWCANVAPRLLGIKDLPAEAHALEKQLGFEDEKPDVMSAYVDVVRRAYRITSLPDGVTNVGQLEAALDARLVAAAGGDTEAAPSGGDRRQIYVARVAHAQGSSATGGAASGTGPGRSLKVRPSADTDPGIGAQATAVLPDTIEDATETTTVAVGDVVALTASEEDMLDVGLDGLAQEVDDPKLLSFPVEDLWVTVTSADVIGRSLESLRDDPGSRRVFLRGYRRAGHEMEFGRATVLDRADELHVQAAQPVLERFLPHVGYAQRNTPETNMVLLGLGIAAGALIGVPTLMVGTVPLSLSTSVGALLAGLVLGYLRGRHPAFGRMPAATDWFLETGGLNFFIAAVGINAGPGFVSGLKEYGISLFLAGVVVTLLPLFIMTLAARYVFHFNPVISLGILAGSRSATAAVGAVREAAKSSVPMLGYTIPYAVANVALTVGGAVVVAVLA